jgi:hypothetical protein
MTRKGRALSMLMCVKCYKKRQGVINYEPVYQTPDFHPSPVFVDLPMTPLSGQVMNTASMFGPHTQTDRGTCPGVGL